MGAKPEKNETAPTGCRLGDAHFCDGNVALACDEAGNVTSQVDCHQIGQQCYPRIGCAICAPGERTCLGDRPSVCREDGTGYEPQQACAADLVCDAPSGKCVTQACADALGTFSYLGCEYWAVPTLSTDAARSGLGQKDVFHFAIAVANASQVAARVSVMRGSEVVAQSEVAVGAVETIELPFLAALESDFSRAQSVETTSSVISHDAAYHLESTAPVAVYQFNPLEYESVVNGEPYFSYSADASLLLPAHVATGNYLVTSRPTLVTESPRTGFLQQAGFAAVIGTSSQAVEVTITSSAFTTRSRDGRIPALKPGETITLTLDPGQVLQLTSAPVPLEQDGVFDCPAGSAPDGAGRSCNVSSNYDLTGTKIVATGPVQLISGHECAFVPFDRQSCDHLEESVPPLESWGTDVVVPVPAQVHGEPHVVRVVSGADNNEIEIEPAMHGLIHLNKGEYYEFESTTDVFISASGPILAAQFLVGSYYDASSTVDLGTSDPSLSFAVPTAQFRKTYTVLSPETFSRSFVTLVTPLGATVTFDGAPMESNDVTTIAAGEGSELVITRKAIAPGPHTLSSATPFGVYVYGYGYATSYMYPGGLDVAPINLF